MAPFIARRAVSLIIVMIGVTVLAFIVLQIIPGDPATALAGPEASDEEVDALRSSLGLDRSPIIQYFTWLGNVLTGDFGTSIRRQLPVRELLLDRLGNTAWLAGASLLIATIIGVGSGVISAQRPGSLLDRGVMTLALFGNSMPTFWFGLMAINIFAVQLDVLPVGGMFDVREGPSLSQTLEHLVLPALTLGLVSAGVIARLTRTEMVDELGADYLRTARARGATERRIVWRHALRNAGLPIVTIIGAQGGFLLSGAILTETVFSWPGLGLLLIESISSRDYPVILGGLLISAIAFTLINFAVDLLYGVLDPRIRHG